MLKSLKIFGTLKPFDLTLQRITKTHTHESNI